MNRNYLLLTDPYIIQNYERSFKQINRRKSKNILSQSVAENIEAFNIKIPQIQHNLLVPH